MRNLLNELYENMRNYEKEKDKIGKEIEKIKDEITNLSTSLNFTDNLSKVEKMKKQMDLSFLQSKLELAETEEKNILNSKLVNFQEDIISKVKKIEENIYVAIRLNDLKYFISFEKLKEKYGEKNYKPSSIKTFFGNNFQNKKIETNLEILSELSPIYEYYKKISDVENEIINPLLSKEKKKMEIQNEIKRVKNNKFIDEKEKEKRIKLITEKYSDFEKIEIQNQDKIKIHEQKLDMLEELIDEMASEVIREDMKKNNIILPKFIKGMRYFKNENEEDTKNSEIVD